MSNRKRRFETLEERRLLSVLAGAAPAAAPAEVAGIMPVAAVGEYSTGAPAANDSADNASEYAAAPAATAASLPTGDAADNSTSYAYASTSSEYGRAYADSYTSDAAYTKPASTPTLTQPQTNQPGAGAPNLQSPNPNLDQHAAVDSSAVSPPVSAGAAGTAGSPPVARSPSDESRFLDADSGAPVAEPAAPPSAGDEQTLVSPVAEAESPGDWRFIDDLAAAALEFEGFARTASSHLVAEPAARSVLSGAAGASFTALEDSIDAVFERLDQLGGELAENGQVSRVGQWVVIAGGACAAFEYARARYREASAWPAASGGPTFYEPRLRRRWFGSRRNSK